jgi:uncharacterized Zn finger protein
MSVVPEVREGTIRKFAGERIFTRGQEYAYSGAIFDTRRQGMTLRSRCQGSQVEAYRVQVTFDEEGISDADCSCPAGSAGGCKHVAALLLTWLAEPEAFTAMEEYCLP